MTMGVFDGIHRGHQELLRLTVKQRAPSALAITFLQNPKKFFLGHYPGDLVTLEQKIAIFRDQGFDYLLLIDFSEEFSKMSGSDFFNHLLSVFDFSSIVVGYDFSFGHRSSTTATEIKNLIAPETLLTILPPVLEGTEAISSTRIRRAITEGRLVEAGALLGRAYSIFIRPDWLIATTTGTRVPLVKVSQVLPPVGRYRVFDQSGEYELTITGTDLLVGANGEELGTELIFM